MSYDVVAFYRFVPLAGLEALREQLLAFCRKAGLRGTILIAPEGINGTVAGPSAGTLALVESLDGICGLLKGEVKHSSAATWPFARMKVRIRPEIITMRAPEADPTRRAGQYVSAREWNDLVSDPDVLLIDTRNRYETKVGTFEGAVDPRIDSFTEFKDYVETALDPARHRKVAMFCTGGIRCEKASSFMLAQGFETVYHLKGGILKYLEEVEPDASRWNGECYVFDERVAVGHGLAPGSWTACFACGQPLSGDETQADSFEAGVSCPHCIDRLTDERARDLRARHLQMTEAKRDASG
ncbi:rhodanese-related sulfurtransferase [Fulvimarina sp. 2208YS6-2-32]|uniref:tRNA uridine(34) hydroxylase n=1 Tax=Fulvimarina uroteuthidis TaxID=3098149 RepID=A0ABU5HYW3_9HYPH|nr:rhodanese-related sulfurtransferase [Fulvimarina sp. 2208YS6-2-32]MDY8107958.1 rhodanese-related sulfurtransferase [Fulvimarina sp. 2208YS6-2-32]